MPVSQVTAKEVRLVGQSQSVSTSYICPFACLSIYRYLSVRGWVFQAGRQAVSQSVHPSVDLSVFPLVSH